METEIVGMIFSRDRAMQLDGTLRSFFLHCRDAKNLPMYVIYKATSPIHERQYAELEAFYRSESGVVFVRQDNFQLDVLRILDPFPEDSWRRKAADQLSLAGHRGLGLSQWLYASSPDRMVLFLVDDNIFVSDFSLAAIRDLLLKRRDAIGFSLRLGKNTTYCYSRSGNQALPAFQPAADGVTAFDWTTGDLDFGYPLEVSSSVYRLKNILPLLRQLPFSNPNTLEAIMALNIRRYERRWPYLLCYERSVTFCAPINIVQETYVNRAGSQDLYQSEELARLFDESLRIDVAKFDGYLPTSCHQEVDLPFEKAAVRTG